MKAYLTPFNLSYTLVNKAITGLLLENKLLVTENKNQSNYTLHLKQTNYTYQFNEASIVHTTITSKQLFIIGKFMARLKSKTFRTTKNVSKKLIVGR